MPEAPASSITIPADYVDDFRDALVYEIENGADAVETARVSLREAADGRVHLGVAPGDWRDEDWRGAVRLLAQDGVLLDQLEAAKPGRAFKAKADTGTLAHACEAMARKVVALRIERLLNFMPLDEKVAAELGQEIERLAWAINRSAQLHGPDDDEGTER